METNELDNILANIGNLGGRDSSQLNFSDVIEVIEQQLETAFETGTMSNQNDIDGGGENNPKNRTVDLNETINNQNDSSTSSLSQAYLKIIEQPAPKKLRFRYVCEGRSAGSIPGVNYTSDNKTFPTIEICNYQGPAYIVVSCVTKDEPYRPHPHKLVGKDCRDGVCTVPINRDTMRISFSNLGIQCVKRRDIASSLAQREKMRVDPFKTGFQHKLTPNFDLNAVRLCFQAFLEGKHKGRYTYPLPPVVSDPIYDRKSSSDLVITNLCACSSSVAGGKKIILLCEKVNRDDISVKFFEEQDGEVVWEAFGEFSSTDVHKQVAIQLKTPKYKTLEIKEPVKVYIQLQRKSDGATSKPIPFDYLPLDSGRRLYWSHLNNGGGFHIKPNIDIFQKILSDANDLTNSLEVNCFENPNTELGTEQILLLDTPTTEDFSGDLENPLVESELKEQEKQQKPDENEIDAIVNECVKEMEIEQEVPMTTVKNDLPISNEKIEEWIRTNDFEQTDMSTTSVPHQHSIPENDKSLYDLLEQVAELDEIYTDHQIRRETLQNTVANEMNNNNPKETTTIHNNLKTADTMDFEESFDDTATYTSLQRAFKNPVIMNDILPLTPPASQLAPEDVNYDAVDVLVNPIAPVIDVNNGIKRENLRQEDEKIPPLPPKRIKKHENLNNSSTDALNEINRPQSNIYIMKTPNQSPPTKKLPPTPVEQKHKKSGFFSKLFSRRKSKPDLNESNKSIPQSKNITPVESREPSISNFSPINKSNRLSTKSVKSLEPTMISERKQKTSKPVGRSVSSVSGKRPHLTPDIVHIPLKGDSSTNSLPMREEYSNASTITLNNNLDRKTVSALQLAELPLQDGNMELVAIADAQSLRNLCEGEYGVQLDPNVDLTEAEHFALYTSIPPKATTSEFDETSCYYAPVDAGEILTPAEVAQRLSALNQPNPEYLRRKRQRFGNNSSLHLLKQISNQEQHQLNTKQTMDNNNFTLPNIPQFSTSFKVEPTDEASILYNIFGDNMMSYRSPNNTPSPFPNAPSSPFPNATSPFQNVPSPFSNTTPPFHNTISPQSPTIFSNFQQQYTDISPNIQIDIVENFKRQQQQLNYQNQLPPWNPNDFNMNHFSDGSKLSQNLEFPQQSSHNWNLPSTSTSIATTAVNLQDDNNFGNNTNQLNMNQTSANIQNQQISDTGLNLSSLLDLDSEQLIQINSNELSGLSLS